GDAGVAPRHTRARGGLRLGTVILPEHRWADAQSIWRRAEELGFEHAWTYDHLAWRSLRDTAWFGAIPTLTAAALVTGRVPLGIFVSSPKFPHPVALPKAIRTLDTLSGGRLTLAPGRRLQGVEA